MLLSIMFPWSSIFIKSLTVGRNEYLFSKGGLQARSPFVYGCCGLVKISHTLPCSTIFPLYITTTLSASSAITPRSWVINIIPMSCSFWRSCISCKMVFCTVTSRAVVGSSAIKTDGSQLIAIAIITLCFCPPEIWCGYVLKILSGSGSCTFLKSSIVRFFASFLSSFWCSIMASKTWSPHVKTGFNEVMGSWKIIAISFPRYDLISSSEAFNRSTFSPFFLWKIISPPLILPGGLGISLIAESEVTDFPEPDSPTIPTVSPLFKVKLILFTAFTVVPSVWNSVTKFLNSNKVLLMIGEVFICYKNKDFY